MSEQEIAVATVCLPFGGVVGDMDRGVLERLAIALLAARAVDGFGGRIYDAQLYGVFAARVDVLLPESRQALSESEVTA